MELKTFIVIAEGATRTLKASNITVQNEVLVVWNDKAIVAVVPVTKLIAAYEHSAVV